MLKIEITTAPHKEQRYDTVGDWQGDIASNSRIVVSDLGDWRLELLVAVHEIVEQALCRHHGVPAEVVDAFDMEFCSKLRFNEHGVLIDEPGSVEGCPYKNEHFVAETIERQLAHELGVNWNEYEEILYDLEY